MSAGNPSAASDQLSSEQVAAVRNEVDVVVASKAFAASQRCQDFLRLVVEHALAGQFDSLQERMIGVQMFGRRVDYDKSNDPVVRVRASEVRRRLAQYYSECAKTPTVRIELPSGAYVPKFQWESLEQSTGSRKEADGAALAEAAAAQAHDEEKGDSRARRPRSRRTPRIAAGVLATATVMAAIAYIGFQAWINAGGTKYEIHSIAVMPLENLSGDPQQEYFADGMTEELISDLGQVSALRVISRTSAMTYKGTKKTIPEIAHELGVDCVVEGSVLREGKQTRITAQLIDARTDRHIWARNYNRSLTSVVALQGEVAQEIADAVKVELTMEQKTRLARARPIDVEAEELYLLGKRQLNLANPRGAIGYFQKSVEKEPGNAQAHAALADSYSWLGDSGIMAYSEAFSNQKAEAVKAIELDEALPEGHVELANAAEILDWDWATEGKELKRALELNPNKASIHWAYCFYLEKIGRIPQALAEMKLGLELDPVAARTFVDSALAYYSARQYDLALAQVKRVEELDPNYDIHFPNYEIHFRLGVIYTEKGMYDEAIKEFLKIGDHPHALGHMGNAYARTGRIAEARATIPKLQEHIRKDGIGTYEIALVYAGLGEKNEALKWLEKAYAARDKGLTYLKVDPCFDPLRSDPRFQDLLRRVGLPV